MKWDAAITYTEWFPTCADVYNDCENNVQLGISCVIFVFCNSKVVQNMYSNVGNSQAEITCFHYLLCDKLMQSRLCQSARSCDKRNLLNIMIVTLVFCGHDIIRAILMQAPSGQMLVNTEDCLTCPGNQSWGRGWQDLVDSCPKGRHIQQINSFATGHQQWLPIVIISFHHHPLRYLHYFAHWGPYKMWMHKKVSVDPWLTGNCLLSIQQYCNQLAHHRIRFRGWKFPR